MIGLLLVGFVALAHIGFAMLEMLFWEKPLGRRIFGTEADFATRTKALAANQGLYNLFLAAGLIASFFLDASAAHWFRYFFLLCVVVAGVFGAITVNRKVFFWQALPAAFGLFFLSLGM